MKKTVYTLPMRFVAMLLCLVLLLSVMPRLSFRAEAVGIDSTTVVADANTMEEWKNPFLPGGLPTTDYAGAIWVDKTVLTAASLAQSGLAGAVTLSDPNNFMIALSAMATNSVVVGQGSVPVDVVFVLDISGSMDSTALTGMVTAANNAIRTLMSGNAENRVGVVLYSNDVTTILPLDHYTGATTNTVTTPTFLTYISDRDMITTGVGTHSRRDGYTIVGPIGSDGNEVEARVECDGGTFIQGGLWEALTGHFETVTDTSNRVPAVILMSDGAPTYTSRNYDNVGDSTHGAGNSSFDGDGFITQLTAAYVKAKLVEQYGKALVYTVGFGLDSIDDDGDKAIATKVLNPAYVHEGIDNLWETYLALAANGQMNVYLGMNGDNQDYTTRVTIRKSGTVLAKNYADRYFAAADAASLNTAFQNIVNDISLQAGYYPTRTDDNGANYSGYITFSDTLGKGMEIKQMAGIWLDGQLLDGHLMAQAIFDPTSPNWVGTADEPTPMGDEFVRAVKQRMGITAPTTEEANAIAWELIRNAYTYGQLSYDAETGEFSNYIGWYGDAEGNYLAPYNGVDPAPAGAEFVNFCYGMLGAFTAFGMESDMMYVTVQMSRRISTGDRMVTFRIPAAMLPTLTYTVNVELDNDQNVVDGTATISVSDATPISLVYEVGVDETLVTPLTVKDYGTLITEGPDAGKYYLYTNAWSAEENKQALKDSTANDMTYAYYEPGPDNEHYYFPKDTALFNADGTPYTGTGTAYFKDTCYTAIAGTQTTQDGVTAYDAEVRTVLVALAAADQAYAMENTDGSWYMPKGTLYANTYNYDLLKTQNGTNATGTHSYVHYGIVDAKVDGTNHHYELMYQGNNGRLVYEPAQGITLTKQIPADATDLEGRSFSFTLTLSADADNTVTLTNGTAQTVQLDASKSLTVELTAGQTIIISGLDAGATYSVVENITDADSYLYHVTGITVDGVSVPAANGTVPAYEFEDVVFTNDDIHYGAFTVSKTVTYNSGTAAVEGKLAEFDVVVTLDGYADRKVTVDGHEVTTDENGKLYLTITDGQVIRIANVPVGTAYTVEEVTTDLPAGYSAVTASGAGTVQTAVTGVALVNAYTPGKVTPDPQFSISGTKYVVDAEGNAATWGAGDGEEFTFQLLTWDGTAWVEMPAADYTVNKGTATKGQPTYSFTMTKEYDQVGDYLYRIAEVIPEPAVAGMTYDHTHHDFRVRITDADLDGQLEMTVEPIDSTVTVTGVAGVENAYTVNADFTNIYVPEAVSVELTALKELTGRELRDGEFTFVLTDAAGNVIGTVTNGKLGDIVFPAMVYTQADTYEYYLTEAYDAANPENNVPGVEYDTTIYHIQIIVTDNAGVLTADVQISKVGSVDPVAAMVFENSYVPEAAVAGPFEATKELYNHTPGAAGPMALTAGQFSFLLEPVVATNPMPEGTVDGVYTAENEADGSITVPAITYTEAGVYQYTLREVKGSVGGYTYDDAVYTITVTVTDDGNGQLEIASTVFTLDDTTTVVRLAFRNDYIAQATGAIPLAGQKVFNVADKNLTRQLTDGEFTFILSDGNGTELERVTNVGNTFAFTALEFDRSGTYTYTVTELYSGTVRNGVTFDTKTHTLVITVADNGQGQLVATAQLDGAAVNVDAIVFGFTNTYDVSDVTLPLSATKSMTGRQPLHEEFQFTLTALEGAPMPEAAVDGALTVYNGYRGLVDFGSITYTAAGTYKYTVHEVKGNLGGVTYDETVYTVTVTVTDNGLGALTAAVTSVTGNEYNDLVFRNSYKAAPAVEDTISAEKHLTNTTPGAEGAMDVEAGDFSFRLTAVTPDAPMPAGAVNGVLDLVNGADGLITVPAITYTEAGVYTYTLEEIPGIASGYTYDTAVYTITVTVTDDGTGQLKSSVSYGEVQEIVFENEYLAQPSSPLVLTGTKHLVGRPEAYPMEDGEFQFTLTGPNVPGGSETVSNVGATFTFSQLVFDTVGVYTYEVTEKPGTVGGVSYDETVYTVTVTVTDDGSGKLQAAITSVTGGEEQIIVFTNTYQAEPATDVVLEGEKNLVNITGGANTEMQFPAGAFSFKLQGQGVEETVTNKADGTFQFPAMEYTEVGVYNYTITEIPGNLSYITYDTTVWGVTVTVTDDGEGQLVAEITYNDGPVVFVNKYQAEESNDVVIGGQKNLLDITGGERIPMDVEDGAFSFILTDASGTVIETVKNTGGSFTFAPLSFPAPGTYTYTVTEVKGTLGYITYDSRSYTVTVTVTDNGEGQLIAQADQPTIVFDNLYKAEAVTDVVLEASKEVNDLTAGQTLIPESGKFSFVLTDAEGKTVETVSNADGKITFAPLSFTSAGVYKYTITEVKGELSGYGYDSAVYTATVTVTDDGEGQLVAEVAYSAAPKFVNTYKASDAVVVLSGTKTFDGGRDLKAGEFQFKLTGEGVEETVSNAADGSFTFSALTYDKAGTYTYTVTEVKGTDAQVTYDDTVFEVTVTVTYENGTLTAKTVIDGEKVQFTNLFTAEPITVDVEVQKLLENLTPYEMGLDGFQFQLVGNGQTLTATSDADGLAKFQLTFDKVGTYTYQVTEVQGDTFGMIYDDSVLTLTVTITQDGATGELIAALEGTLEFTNIYEDLPSKTSDSFNLVAWVMTLIVTSMCLAALLIFGRKRIAR